jgi:uncharacterized protein YodC (DUF2158 family)
MALQFKVGDIVELNSGGEAMTVVKTSKTDIVCQWFSKGGRLNKNQFPVECLREKPKPVLSGLEMYSRPMVISVDTKK